MRQRLRFGAPVSLGKVAMRGAIGGSVAIVQPSFGPRCVCCNADTASAVRYEASDGRSRSVPVAVPICDACTGHAFAPRGLTKVGAAFCAAVGA